jgi:quercetin dioxygenase-like cupin family protein
MTRYGAGIALLGAIGATAAGAALASQAGSAAEAGVQVIDMHAAAPESVAPGLTRRFVTGERATFAIFNFTKGAVVPEHSHPNEQVSYIPSGHVRVTAGGRVHELRSGQVIVIPPNVPHSFEALEDTVDLDFFTPVRSDWLTGRDTYFKAQDK